MRCSFFITFIFLVLFIPVTSREMWHFFSWCKVHDRVQSPMRSVISLCTRHPRSAHEVSTHLSLTLQTLFLQVSRAPSFSCYKLSISTFFFQTLIFQLLVHQILTLQTLAKLAAYLVTGICGVLFNCSHSPLSLKNK